MNVRDILIAILVFVVVSLVFLSSANDVNNSFLNTGNYSSTAIDSKYLNDYGVESTNSLISNISDKAPGGANSEFSSGSTTSDIKLGYQTGSLIFKTPGIIKNIVMGTNSSSQEGLGSALGIRHEFLTLLITAFFLIIAIILISSLLPNKF